MAEDSPSPLDLLWDEYAAAFDGFDDLTLARWMSQTLSQIEGRVWRVSHPLFGAYRLAAQVARRRHLTLRTYVTVPPAYPAASCCGAPLVPLLSRDVVESGLICQHCNATAVPFDELPQEMAKPLRDWSEEYAPVHRVAHAEERGRPERDDEEFEKAAQSAERLLAYAGLELAPALLEWFPVVIWEDQDECLEVRPEDIPDTLD